ncbi:MAG TPA: peptide-methionine (S)-S-oxide reductase MsrA [Vicinamibacterales bacterium]|nr:peptide-methionine (S)-S-oxide reductase MsrA [Vicinamibacterales bacterium]
MSSALRVTLAASALALAAACIVTQGQGLAIPAPEEDLPQAATPTPRTAVFAGGCFWGMQSVFEHVRGVTRVVAGYAGGNAATAHYEMVETGRTGHAESIEVTYDASRVSYGTLLRVFFGVAHDPTTLNRQGPDEGTQYRSAIFYGDPDQQRVARAYIAQLARARAFRDSIVTALVALPAFYPAEDYHQDYAEHHPDDMYIRINDAPKLVALRKTFPELYSGK